MKVAVSNSGPLIHLALIKRLDLLFYLFNKVIIPKSVYNEVIERGLQQSHHDARYIQKEIDEGRIEVRSASNELLKEIHNDNLHEGELEVIAVALEIRGKIVLLDDEEARLFASTFNLKIKGTLGEIIENVHSEAISPRKGKELIKALNKIMYLSSDVFSFSLESISPG